MEHQLDTFDPEFDHVYLIDAQGTITDATGVHEPDVWNHPTDDVYVQGDGWSVLTDHSGQHGYHGAVMHASELWGSWATDDLTERVEEDGRIAFCVVEVRDEDGSLPDGDPIGWAVAWKVAR